MFGERNLNLFILTPIAGTILDNFPEAQTLNLISRTAISPDFDLFFK